MIMSQKNNVLNYFTKAKINEEFIKRNSINIYRLAATIEKIENRVYKKVS